MAKKKNGIKKIDQKKIGKEKKDQKIGRRNQIPLARKKLT